jgi:hypothetical protein
MRKLLKTLNAPRRRIMQLINKNYTKNKLSKRKGKCLKCGKCCGDCKFLDKKTKLCTIHKNRPWNCYKDFPLDNLDQKIWNVNKNCGYKFVKK